MILSDNLQDTLRTLPDDKLLEIRSKVISDCPISSEDKAQITAFIDGLIDVRKSDL